MPVKPPLLDAITSPPPAEAWACIAAHLQDEFFAPITAVGAESEGAAHKLTGAFTVIVRTVP
jgi:hypothetical protein